MDEVDLQRGGGVFRLLIGGEPPGPRGAGGAGGLSGGGPSNGRLEKQTGFLILSQLSALRSPASGIDLFSVHVATDVGLNALASHTLLLFRSA